MDANQPATPAKLFPDNQGALVINGQSGGGLPPSPPTPAASPASTSPFDQIRRFRPDGTEFWSAREMMPYLGYAKWERMQDAVERAKAACQNSGYAPDDHFPGAGKSVEFGKGGKVAADFHLSRYGCYLLAMNGDPRKAEVAAAQHYFATRTREAELVATLVTARAPVDPATDPILIALKAVIAVREDQLALRSVVADMKATLGGLVAIQRAGQVSLLEAPRSEKPAAPLTTRAKVNRLVRDYTFKHSLDHDAVWNRLYTEFRDRYQFDARVRAKNAGVRPLDIIAAENLMEELFAVASEVLV